MKPEHKSLLTRALQASPFEAADGNAVVAKTLHRTGYIDIRETGYRGIPLEWPIVTGITPLGVEMLEREERERREGSLRAKMARGGLWLLQTVLAAVLAALMLRWFGPTPVCAHPCQCDRQDRDAGKKGGLAHEEPPGAANASVCGPDPEGKAGAGNCGADNRDVADRDAAPLGD